MGQHPWTCQGTSSDREFTRHLSDTTIWSTAEREAGAAIVYINKSKPGKTPKDATSQHVRQPAEPLLKRAIKEILDTKEAHNIASITITGGVGGGKTTVTKALVEVARAHGYLAVLKPENAIAFFESTNYERSWIADDLTTFQENLLSREILMQLMAIRDAATMSRKSTKPVLVVCDRSPLDGEAFTDSTTWQEVVRNLGLRLEDLWALLSHTYILRSAASQNTTLYEFGPGTPRMETPELAVTNQHALGPRLQTPH